MHVAQNGKTCMKSWVHLNNIESWSFGAAILKGGWRTASQKRGTEKVFVFVRLPLYCTYMWFLRHISPFLSFSVLLSLATILRPPFEISVPNDSPTMFVKCMHDIMQVLLHAFKKLHMCTSSVVIVVCLKQK